MLLSVLPTMRIRPKVRGARYDESEKRERVKTIFYTNSKGKFEF
jgi:hypothetical protein